MAFISKTRVYYMIACKSNKTAAQTEQELMIHPVYIRNTGEL